MLIQAIGMDVILTAKKSLQLKNITYACPSVWILAVILTASSNSPLKNITCACPATLRMAVILTACDHTHLNMAKLLPARAPCGWLIF